MADDAPTALTATINPPPDGSLDCFSIVTADPDQGGVTLFCNGLVGNQPKANRNTVALWDMQGPRPDAKPLEIFPLPDDTQPSTFLLAYPLSPLDYTLTYQVGESLTTMCALTPLHLFPKLGAWTTRVSMTIRKITTASIEIQYAVLPGYQPNQFGNWIGLWQGNQIAYGAPDPIGAVGIASSQSQGIVTLAGLELYSGFDYSLYHFMAPKAEDPGLTTAGAALYFST